MVAVFFVHICTFICTFARRPHSLTSPPGLRSLSALLAQIARSVCGTTCDDDRRSFRRQLLCRIFARFAFIIIAIHISLILNIELYLLNSYLPLPHFATPDVLNAVAHSCSTLGVASVGIHLYIFVDYIWACGSGLVASVGIFVHHSLHFIGGSKHHGLPAVAPKVLRRPPYCNQIVVLIVVSTLASYLSA